MVVAASAKKTSGSYSVWLVTCRARCLHAYLSVNVCVSDVLTKVGSPRLKCDHVDLEKHEERPKTRDCDERNSAKVRDGGGWMDGERER
eukprot:6185826-Pleurochrysis_carterae.AAC.1